MDRRIGLVTVVVPTYEEALAFYVSRLGFVLVADDPLPGGKRWVVVRPSAAAGAGLLLAEAADVPQRAVIGGQAGGRVFLFLETDDFERDHAAFGRAGVVFIEAPRDEPYGRVAVFVDAFGNLWDLIEPKARVG